MNERVKLFCIVVLSVLAGFLLVMAYSLHEIDRLLDVAIERVSQVRAIADSTRDAVNDLKNNISCKSFSGVGISLSVFRLSGNKLEVESTVKNSPAEKAGL